MHRLKFAALGLDFLEDQCELRVYRDEDADLSVIKKKTIAVIGYGSQGRAQSLNVMDRGLNSIARSDSDSEIVKTDKQLRELLGIREH